MADRKCSCPRPARCRRLALRSWHVLVISLLLVSAQTYDWPGAIAPYLHRIGLSGEQLGALYSSYHAPNIILVLLGGVLIDLIGPDLASVGFTAVIVASAGVLVSGASFARMVVSRVLLGIGGESANVAQLALLNRAFDSGSGQRPDCITEFPSIAVAYAISNVVVRATTVAMLYSLPGLVGSYGWVGMNLITALSLLSFVVSIGLLSMERGWIPCCDVRPAVADVEAVGAHARGEDGSGGSSEARTAADAEIGKGEGKLVAAATAGAAADNAGAEAHADADSTDAEDGTDGDCGAADESEPFLASRGGGTSNSSSSSSSSSASSSSAAAPVASAESAAAVRERKQTTRGCLLTRAVPDSATGSAASAVLVESGRAAAAAQGDQDRDGDGGSAPGSRSCAARCRRSCICCPGAKEGSSDDDSGGPSTSRGGVCSWLDCFSQDFCGLPLAINMAFVLSFTAFVLPYGEISTALFAGVYGYSDEAAARVSSVGTIVSLVAMIPYGLLIDYKLLPYHVAIICGALLIAPAFAMLAAGAAIPPELPSALGGLGSAAINTAVWPLMGFRLPREVQGRVLGLLSALQNAVMVAAPLIIGVLRDTASATAAANGGSAARDGFGPAMWYLFSGVLVCIAFAVWMAFLDGWQEPRHVLHLAPGSKLAKPPSISSRKRPGGGAPPTGPRKDVESSSSSSSSSASTFAPAASEASAPPGVAIRIGGGPKFE